MEEYQGGMEKFQGDGYGSRIDPAVLIDRHTRQQVIDEIADPSFGGMLGSTKLPCELTQYLAKSSLSPKLILSPLQGVMKMIENLGAPAVLIFIGALISAAGAIWASQRQAVSELELRQKSEEIAELNKQISASITGGDSFAYMVPVFLKNAENSPRLTLIHQGKYPLYDLTVRIVDVAKFEKMVQEKYSFSDMLKDEMHMSIGNVAPNQASMFGPVTLSSGSLRWNLFFSGRNGFFTESLRVRRVVDGWTTAVKVTRSSPTSGETKTLFEKIDPGYPLGKNGQVEW